MTLIKVSYMCATLRNKAEALALQLGLPKESCADGLCLSDCAGEIPKEFDYFLNVSAEGISLIPAVRKSHGPIRCDFTVGVNEHRRKYGGGIRQSIAKAVGISGNFFPQVLDLTAGMGSDAFVFASLGCKVKMIERNLIIHCLLSDGLARASEVSDPRLAEIISRMQLYHIDSKDYLQGLPATSYPDVIYLDPMFPERKKSALAKKEMQAFNKIVGADDDSEDLLREALQRARYRVVIKRPNCAGHLGDIKPNYFLKGKSTRYDIFVLRKLPN